MIENVRCIKIPRANGLVGFAKFDLLGCFHVGNVAIYECPRSGYRLVYPDRKLKNGKSIGIFYPFTDEAREAVHKAVVDSFLNTEDYVTAG